MPVTVLEKFESRQASTGQNAQVELAYTIAGSDDDLAVKSALAGAAPGTYDGLVLQSLHVEPVGPELWNGVARYGTTDSQPPETGDSTFSFDTGGGSQHITQSISTSGRYPNDAPDFQGAIGVTHDNVEGVDITIPVYQFAETHYLPDSMVTLGYRGTLFYLTGKVNNAGFRGLAAGECLFLGASGSRRANTGSGAPDWEITFKFAGSPNVTGLTVGPITGINKKGWEYMWVRYEDAEDEDASELVKRPTAVYIEKVYEEGSFAALGIGT